MFGFQITKWFWNLWDHLFTIVLLNLLFLVLLGGSFYLFQILSTSLLPNIGDSLPMLLPVSVVLLIFLVLFLVTVLQHAYAMINYSIAKFERSDWKESLRLAWTKPSLCAALLFDLIIVALGIIFFVSWRFYSQQGGLFSLIAMVLLFWLGLFVALSFGFYFPMLVREEFMLKRALRQSIVTCLDNLFLSVGLALVALVLFLLSFIPPLMLLFGPLGLGLWYEVSLRILFYKYQYLEQLPEDERINARGYRNKLEIPWRVLLREERERIGPRSLRNFIFPWKD